MQKMVKKKKKKHVFEFVSEDIRLSVYLFQIDIINVHTHPFYHSSIYKSRS